MTVLETNRLILRDLQDSDLPALIAMNQNTEVMQYFPKPYSQAESLQLYQGIQDEVKAYGYSLWAVEEKSSQEFIGLVGLHHSDLRIFAGKEAVEIGWRLRKEFLESWLCDGGCPSLSRLCFSASWLIRSLLFYILA